MTQHITSNILNSYVLTVTPEGEFIWNENADQMIEEGDFKACPAMPHILRRLRMHDQLVNALQHAAQCVQTNYCPDMGGYDWDELIAKATGETNGN